jgi:colanic acid biosynthesis protein WcaH
MYDTADMEGVEMKHYLANGYVVHVVDGQPRADEQHDELKIFNSTPEHIHENVQAYLHVSENFPNWP